MFVAAQLSSVYSPVVQRSKMSARKELNPGAYSHRTHDLTIKAGDWKTRAGHRMTLEKARPLYAARARKAMLAACLVLGILRPGNLAAGALSESDFKQAES